MESVLFVIPPYSDYDDFLHPDYNDSRMLKGSREYKRLVTDMPIGLLSLSAYIKKQADVRVALLDFNILLNEMENFGYSCFEDMFRDTLKKKERLDFNPGVIGISALFTSTYYNMLSLAKVFREIFPTALIIAGGGVPTNMYGEIFKSSPFFDALCYGEGERPLAGLLQAKSAGGDRLGVFLEEHKSWITRKKAEAGQSFRYDFIENLDEIPFYDYDILDASQNNLQLSGSGFSDFNTARNVYASATSRGCPHRCCFCASHSVHGWKMRYHSAERIREDLTRLKSDYAAETIFFQDDHFMADKQRALAIVEGAKELGLKIFFQNGLAVYALDRKTLEVLKNAGIDHLVLSLESGSERVLKEIMHKPLDLSIVRRVTSDCRDLHIDVDINILIGLPGETKQDIEDTREFLKTLYPSWFRIYIAVPLVGSEMYGICVKNGYLSGNHIGTNWKRSVIETPDFTTEFIREKVYSLNLELNFVRNSDFRLGDCEKALAAFEYVIRVKNDHAFAYYFAAKCCEMLKRDERYSYYKSKYLEVLEKSAFWKKYADQFDLTPLS